LNLLIYWDNFLTVDPTATAFSQYVPATIRINEFGSYVITVVEEQASKRNPTNRVKEIPRAGTSQPVIYKVVCYSKIERGLDKFGRTLEHSPDSSR